MDKLECPSSSLTVFRSIPFMTNLDAKSWRISCHLKFSIPAVSRSSLHAFLSVSNFFPVLGFGKTRTCCDCGCVCSFHCFQASNTTSFIGTIKVFLLFAFFALSNIVFDSKSMSSQHNENSALRRMPVLSAVNTIGFMWSAK